MDIEVFARRVMELFPQLMKAFASHEDNDLASGRITLPQFWALYYLSLKGKCKMKELSGHLGISPAAATGLIDRLIRQGLVRRSDDREDRRIVWIVLSPSGREMICRIRKQRAAAIKRVFGKLSADDRGHYVRILERIVSMAQPEGDCPARSSGADG